MESRPVILDRYNYDAIPRPGVFCDPKTAEGRSRTLQSGKDEADINFIMARYEKTGLLGSPLDDVSARIPHFGDFSDIGDYHAVLSRTRDLERNFLMLPAAVRARFGNDPAVLLEFLADPANAPEAVRLGVVEAPKKAPLGDAAPAQPAAAAAPAAKPA